LTREQAEDMQRELQEEFRVAAKVSEMRLPARTTSDTAASLTFPGEGMADHASGWGKWRESQT
jgi:hypothetical protein